MYHDKRPPEYNFFNRVPLEFVLTLKSTVLILIGAALLLFVLRVIFPITEFGDARLVLTWGDLLVLVVLISLFFCVEYSWISRSLNAERQDEPIVPLGREAQHAQIERLWSDTERNAPKRKRTGIFKVGKYEVDVPDWWDRRNSNPLLASSSSAGGLSQRRRYITRRLEQATLAHFFYDMRVPVIISRINLGFDDLRHSRIIEAMLVQLRDRYREHFKSPSSKVGFTGLMLMIGLTLILTNLLSNNFFAQQTDADGKPVLIQSALRLEDEEGKGPATYDYCGYFKLKPSDLRPTATGVICLLPWSNSLFDLLYTPVLRLRYIGGDSRMIDGETSVRDYLNKDKSVPPFPYSFRVNDDSLIFRLFLDRNFDLPSVKPSKEVGRLFNSDEESVQTWRIENGGLSITTLTPPLTAPTELMELPHSPILWKAQPTFRVYHILIMFCVWFALMSINRTLKIWPYASRMEEMSRLLELIRGRITQTNVDTPKVGWFRWVLGLKRHDESIETTPDARVVEQAFIDLLRRLNPNHEGPRPFFSTWFEIRPEMVFVFDEMDKLSGKVDPETSRVDEAAASVEENTRERQRALQLHRLLSDMKRLLSSNSARFIFIGGRLYHDEWLADQVDRTPLLSSIFSEQIYLPSMLTDRDHSYGRFNDRIAEYLILMFRNAEHRMNHRKLKHQSLPFVGSTGLSKPTYVQGNLPHSGHPKRMAMMAHYVNMRVRDEFGQHYGTPFNTGHLRLDEFGQHADTHSNIEQLQKQEAIHLTSGEIETLEQLLNFLTYRSAGNPKKMKELLQSLIVPSSNAFQLSRYKSIEQKSVRFQIHPALPIDRPEDGHHYDCILLDDKRLYRIQFIDVLYRHLTEHLESRMLERDDKVAMSIFYLMDFLLKFHNRGFSWTNLQRVDELSHIHRAPDLRSMMGVLVEVSSERFLHRVWNGVYAFRFRSDFAREIDYLSRISKEEMAALNFTLDESQDLKGLYQETIRRGDHENVDTISGLGELYEYDQDFEIARNYYRRALEVLDASFLNSYAPSLGTSSAETVTIADEWKALGSGAKISSNKDDDTMFRPMGLILSAPDSPESKRAISSNFSWAIARLRLLLQIGHTYEQERNFERALGTYMHAQSFSQAILDAQPAQDLTRLDSHLDLTRGVITPENYSILYQASMAGAWVFEKGNQDPDDSIAHAERSVFRLYNKNPMLWRQRLSELSGDQATLRQMKLGIRLFASDLHDRVGDLYFYKGKQSLRQIKNVETYQQIDHNSEDSLRFGYLLEAHYHYALSIWNIRNYLGLRRRSSGTRLNIMAKPKELGSLESPFYGKTTIKGDGVFPDLIHNNLANTFTDMSEAILARSAVGELLRDYMELPAIDQSEAINIPPARDRFRQQLGDCVREFTKRISYTEDNEFIPPKADELKEYRLYSILEDASESRSIKIFDRTIEAASGGVWLGDGTSWADRYEQYSKERTLQFRTIVKQDHRFNAAIYFSNVAAKNFAIAGYSIDAASEYLLQAQTLIGLMWTMRQTKWMAKEGAANARENVRKMLFPVHELDQRGFPKFGFIKLLKAFSRDSDTPQSLQEYLTELLCPSALKQGQTESDIRDKWHRYLSDKRRTIISSKWDNFLMSNLINDKESSWKRLEDWTRASVDPLETAKMHLALMAHTALRRAAKAIQISYRPSATRYGQNHGDPNKFENDIIRKAREVVFQVVLETPQLVHKAPLRNHIYSKPIGTGDGLDKVAVLRGLTELHGTELQDDDIRSFVNSLIEGNETMANTNFSRNDLRISEETYKSIKFLVDRLRELRADDSSVSNATQGNTRFNADRKQELEQDYQMSQSWKDEPRLTTLAAQLVLGLAEQTGKDGLCNKMAVDVYDNFLREYAKDQFPRLSEDQVVKNRQIDIIRKTYNGLHNQTEKFRFPILNRLRSLRVMCDAAIFHGPVVLDQYDGEGENKIYREHAGLIGHLCNEMSFTYDLYDSETHFSPHLLGTSLGLAFFYCVRNGHRVLYDVNTGDEWDEERVEEFVTTKTRDWKDKPTLSSVTITRESLAEISLNLLRRSEQMYSLGKAYYENIAHMQYLNDDFNDRITHYNQATRMMYSEFTSCMIGAVHDELFH